MQLAAIIPKEKWPGHFSDPLVAYFKRTIYEINKTFPAAPLKERERRFFQLIIQQANHVRRHDNIHSPEDFARVWYMLGGKLPPENIDGNSVIVLKRFFFQQECRQALACKNTAFFVDKLRRPIRVVPRPPLLVGCSVETAAARCDEWVLDEELERALDERDRRLGEA